jgi:hypothetical protein
VAATAGGPLNSYRLRAVYSRHRLDGQQSNGPRRGRRGYSRPCDQLACVDFGIQPALKRHEKWQLENIGVRLAGAGEPERDGGGLVWRWSLFDQVGEGRGWGIMGRHIKRTW